MKVVVFGAAGWMGRAVLASLTDKYQVRAFDRGPNEVVPKKLSDRVHECPHCNLVLDRDHNAAINIKKAAVALRVPILGIPICRERCVGCKPPRNPLLGDRSAEPCKTRWEDVSDQPRPFRAG